MLEQAGWRLLGIRLGGHLADDRRDRRLWRETRDQLSDPARGLAGGLGQHRGDVLRSHMRREKSQPGQVGLEEDARKTDAVEMRQGTERAFPPRLGNTREGQRAKSSSENEQDT